jgi:hypothetical protein
MNKVEIKKTPATFTNADGKVITYQQLYLVINGRWVPIKVTSKNKDKKQLVLALAEEVIFKDTEQKGE